MAREVGMGMVEVRIGIICGNASGAQAAELAGEEGSFETRMAEAAKAKIAEIYAKIGPVLRSGARDDIVHTVLWFASNRSTFDDGVLGGWNFSHHHDEVKRARDARTFVSLRSLAFLLACVIACRCPELRH